MGHEPEIVMWVAGRPETCNLAVARRVDFDRFLRTHSSLHGQCVAVSGWWISNVLLRDRPDAGDSRLLLSEEFEGVRVGVYGRPEMMRQAPRRPRRHVLVGIAGVCDTLGEGAVMVMGYCHYVNGPYIAVAEAHSAR